MFSPEYPIESFKVPEKIYTWDHKNEMKEEKHTRYKNTNTFCNTEHERCWAFKENGIYSTSFSHFYVFIFPLSQVLGFFVRIPLE